MLRQHLLTCSDTKILGYNHKMNTYITLACVTKTDGANIVKQLSHAVGYQICRSKDFTYVTIYPVLTCPGLTTTQPSPFLVTYLFIFPKKKWASQDVCQGPLFPTRRIEGEKRFAGRGYALNGPARLRNANERNSAIF